MMKIEEYNLIKVIPVYDKDWREQTLGVVCDYCELGETDYCQNAEIVPCASIRGFDKIHHFRKATPEEIQQASINDAVELASKAIPKLMEIPCSDEPQGKKK